jgi:hypothetical protein
MKPVKNLVFATLLVFSIVFNTIAGEVEVPGAPKPPDPARTTTTTEETLPDTSTDTQQTTVESSDYIIFEALAALLSVY